MTAATSFLSLKGPIAQTLLQLARIIEMHGGRIWVELQPGQGPRLLRRTLPVIVERQVEAA